MSPPPEKPTRLLVLWGAAHFEGYFNHIFPADNPRYTLEIVSGDRSSGPSPHAASWGRLLKLRRRLQRGEFDLVVSGPIQNSPWPRNKRLATRLAQAARFFTYKHRMLDTFWAPWLLRGELKKRVPLAVVDFLDTSYVLPKDFALLRAATLYFKLNLYFWPRRSLMPLETFFGMRRVTENTFKLRPLSNGIPRQRIPHTARPMRERDIDICFTGTIVPVRSKDDPNPFPDETFNPIRKQIYERCLKLKDRYNVYCVNRVVPKEEYLELLQRSKLMICTESFGCETFRHYEVSASGAVPLVNWPYSQNHLPLQPDVHAIYFSLIGDDFERVVERALADPEQLAAISEQTRAFTVACKQQHQIGEWIIEETLREHAARSSGVALAASS
jgi:hypothetical protein